MWLTLSIVSLEFLRNSLNTPWKGEDKLENQFIQWLTYEFWSPFSFRFKKVCKTILITMVQSAAVSKYPSPVSALVIFFNHAIMTKRSESNNGYSRREKSLGWISRNEQLTFITMATNHFSSFITISFWALLRVNCFMYIVLLQYCWKMSVRSWSRFLICPVGSFDALCLHSYSCCLEETSFRVISKRQNRDYTKTSWLRALSLSRNDLLGKIQ